MLVRVSAQLRAALLALRIHRRLAPCIQQVQSHPLLASFECFLGVHMHQAQRALKEGPRRCQVALLL